MHGRGRVGKGSRREETGVEVKRANSDGHEQLVRESQFRDTHKAIQHLHETQNTVLWVSGHM